MQRAWRRLRSLVALGATMIVFTSTQPSCKSGSSGGGPSLRADCARFLPIAEAERKKIPDASSLKASRMEVNAAIAIREYAGKLDQIAVTDTKLNNKLADYTDLLRRFAKSLDELWTAGDATRDKVVDKLIQISGEESKQVNDINDYCQSAP